MHFNYSHCPLGWGLGIRSLWLVNRYFLPFPIREMLRFWRRHDKHSHDDTEEEKFIMVLLLKENQGNESQASQMCSSTCADSNPVLE